MELMFDRQLDYVLWFIFFFSSRRRHTRFDCDWSSDVCSSDLIFGGIPDGGGFQAGNQTANAQQSALGWTHTISPTLINEARAGLSYLHTTRVSPRANDLSNLPLTQGGVMDIPQLAENGGLPAFGISGLA